MSSPTTQPFDADPHRWVREQEVRRCPACRGPEDRLEVLAIADFWWCDQCRKPRSPSDLHRFNRTPPDTRSVRLTRAAGNYFRKVRRTDCQVKNAIRKDPTLVLERVPDSIEPPEQLEAEFGGPLKELRAFQHLAKEHLKARRST